jgi:hypothetical protein
MLSIHFYEGNDLYSEKIKQNFEISTSLDYNWDAVTFYERPPPPRQLYDFIQWKLWGGSQEVMCTKCPLRLY